MVVGPGAPRQTVFHAIRGISGRARIPSRWGAHIGVWRRPIAPPAAIGPSFPAVGPPSSFVQSQPTQGYVLLQIGDLPPVPARNATAPHFELVSRMHESWATSPIAAFVSPEVPDPHPENNCGD
jgi:hypothetical protein